MTHTARAFLAVIAITLLGALLLHNSLGAPVQAAQTHADPRLAKCWRFERNGWIYVHLEGPPRDIGFQHGALLAKEIKDAFEADKLNAVHNSRHDWNFFRTTAEKVLWPHIDPEYQQELTGITVGLQSRYVQMDLWDVTALNAIEELPGYYVPWLEKQGGAASGKGAGAQSRDSSASSTRSRAPGNCSAFVATGSWTKDHDIVIAHNNWTGYLDGERWRVIFDIVPAKGNHILMDGYPGIIASNDDFGVNSAGIMVTETTISDFFGFDPNGKPEFMRARKAMQYANSIDEYVQIMNDGNNGGYANDWLLGDRKTGEIARLEEGLKHTRVWRTRDGYFEGSNFPSDPEVIRDETSFDVNDASRSENARKARWRELLEENKGKIDPALAQQFLSDHYDTFEKKPDAPSERTLCGHVELSPRGFKGWLPPYYPGGTAQNKVADSAMAEKMSFQAHMGHACGQDFKAKPFLEQHPEFNWQQPLLRDLDAGGWATFEAGERK